MASGATTIPSVVFEGLRFEGSLALEIGENLARQALTPIEQALYTEKRLQLFMAWNPGADKAVFVRETARQTGVSGSIAASLKTVSRSCASLRSISPANWPLDERARLTASIVASEVSHRVFERRRKRPIQTVCLARLLPPLR